MRALEAELAHDACDDALAADDEAWRVRRPLYVELHGALFTSDRSAHMRAPRSRASRRAAARAIGSDPLPHAYSHDPFFSASPAYL